MVKHRIVYPDGTEEIIEHYGMFAHSSGGFAFYISPEQEGQNFPVTKPYIFISGSNVRKIIPL